MVINHLDKLFVTSDAATIIRELEVVHPAGKVLVMASQQQEHEVSTRSGTWRVLVVGSISGTDEHERLHLSIKRVLMAVI